MRSIVGNCYAPTASPQKLPRNLHRLHHRIKIAQLHKSSVAVESGIQVLNLDQMNRGCRNEKAVSHMRLDFNPRNGWSFLSLPDRWSVISFDDELMEDVVRRGIPKRPRKKVSLTRSNVVCKSKNIHQTNCQCFRNAASVAEYNQKHSPK